MPAWKVLLIGFFAVVCFGLVVATALVPMNYSGGERWGWMAGLGGGALVMATLFILFLRHADKQMDAKPSRR